MHIFSPSRFKHSLGTGGVGSVNPVAGQRDDQLEVPLAGLRDDEVHVLQGRLVVAPGLVRLQLVAIADTVSKHPDHCQVVGLCTTHMQSVLEKDQLKKINWVFV